MRVTVLVLGFLFSLGLSACGKKESRSEDVSAPKPKVEDALPTDGEERYRATYVKAAQAFSRND